MLGFIQGGEWSTCWGSHEPLPRTASVEQQTATRGTTLHRRVFNTPAYANSAISPPVVMYQSAYNESINPVNRIMYRHRYCQENAKKINFSELTKVNLQIVPVLVARFWIFLLRRVKVCQNRLSKV